MEWMVVELDTERWEQSTQKDGLLIRGELSEDDVRADIYRVQLGEGK